ncbi:MAG TPA: branched-chain amino acid ABC transporter ATP-binding protein/permease, partial [Pseudomonadota bacterium]|nr:branched-chain amino acid ABC transporter ATP-binding protein/permease [Pseudomonadota bacterium]
MLGAYALTVLTLMGIWSIVALGLNIITGYAGQFNLGIGVYMGTGAYATAMLTTGAGFDFWLALPCALAVSATMGFLTGLPALRVREDALAVLTIGLVFVFESLLVYLPYFGGPVGIGRIPPATISGSPLGKEAYLALVLVALLLVIAVTLYLKRAWIGLAWASIRESELAANVIGIHPARFKLYAFAVGATFAGLGGVLYAHFIRYITPYDFGFLTSIYVLTMIVFGGVGTIRGAVLGACVLTLLPELFRFVQDYRNLIYGATLIALMLYEPRGVLGDGSFVWRWVLAQWAPARLALASRKPATRASPAIAGAGTGRCTKSGAEASRMRSQASLLQTRDLTRRFGGLVAVNGVSIEVFPREIFGVIGPNGAGKTTFFNLLSGIISCSSGEIRFKEGGIGDLAPHRIARLGIGRTFQIVRPFGELSVMDNVFAGLGSRYCTGFVDALGLHSRKSFREEARAILAQANLGEYENETACNLPLGLLRRLEIARALGLRPDLILLDESFSGLSHREAQSLLDLVRSLRAGGMTIILIEHNMQITMQ